MKKPKKNDNVKGRFILMLDDDSAGSIKRVESELQVKLTSSAELSAKVKAEEVLSSDKGIFYKNIGVAVVNDVEAAQLIHSNALGSNKILHWEPDRIYKTADQKTDCLNNIQNQLQLLNNSVKELEILLTTETDVLPQPKVWAWGLKAMGIDASKYSGKGVDVCVLDTGLYLSHPDFKGRSIIGKSFIPNEPWDYDGNGHGTHCTGVAAGYLSLSNGTRYGIAYGANIVIGKVLADSGSGATSGIVDAIDWVLQKKFKIVSMSLASPVKIGEKPSPIFEQIGQKALQQNTLIIAAAGNDSSRPDVPKPVSSPANADSIMAVGAVDNKMSVADFSNGGINASTGGKVDLAGPGVDVYSSYSKNANGKVMYRNLSGTSMATPHISGLAALYWEAEPHLSAKEIWTKLENKALKLDGKLKRDVGSGLGFYSK